MHKAKTYKFVKGKEIPLIGYIAYRTYTLQNNLHYIVRAPRYTLSDCRLLSAALNAK